MPPSPDRAESSQQISNDPNRRQFMHAAGAAAAGAAILGASSAPTACTASTNPNLLPTIKLGEHRVTRLILGGNPVYGYSHFNNLYSQHLRDFHTPQRVMQLLRDCEKAGVNTWQNSYTDRTVDDTLKCREAGINFHWLMLGKANWEDDLSIIEKAAKLGPIGISPHGSHVDRLHRQGRMDFLVDMLKRIRDTGVLVGMSCHDPKVLELSEEKGWDVDYYMACCYNRTRPQSEIVEILGEAPLGEVYLESDRPRMFEAVRAASKPCLVYKVLAAGRTDLSPRGIRRRFEETLAAIKPTDAMIIGMFQEFGDQVGENAKAVREILAS